MTNLQEEAREFLSCERIAVVGVSRDPRQTANAIYKKLRHTVPHVFAVNPRSDSAEGDPCYPDLRSIPGGVQAAVLVVPPSSVLEIVRQCHELRIDRVWMHRSIGSGSVSTDAVDFCRMNSIRVIAGACPMMYCQPVDFAHRCMRTVLGWFGGLPRME